MRLGRKKPSATCTCTCTCSTSRHVTIMWLTLLFLFPVVASNRQARRDSITDSSYMPQPTPTYSPIPTPITSEENKKNVSKIKPDPSLVKVRREEMIPFSYLRVYVCVFSLVSFLNILPFHIHVLLNAHIYFFHSLSLPLVFHSWWIRVSPDASV